MQHIRYGLIQYVEQCVYTGLCRSMYMWVLGWGKYGVDMIAGSGSEVRHGSYECNTNHIINH